MLDLWYVTGYMSRTTAAHLLHYPASKPAFILPLPLSGSVNVTRAACSVGSCDSIISAKWKPWMAFLRSATNDKQLVNR